MYDVRVRRRVACAAITAGLVAVLGYAAPLGAQQPGSAPAPRAADHEAWRAALDGLKTALAARDLARARTHARVALLEAVYFEPDDPRLRETHEATTELDRVSISVAPDVLLNFYIGILRDFDAAGRGSSFVALEIRTVVATAQMRRRDFQRAAATLRELRARSEPSGPTLSFWLQGTLGLAHAEFDTGHSARALELAREAAERASARFGPEHMAVYKARSLEARALRQAGRSEEAAAAYATALKLGQRMPPASATEVALLRIDYGTFLMELCRFDDAARELQSGIDGAIAMTGPASPEITVALNRLAKTETLRGDWLAAQPVAQRAVRAAEDGLRRAPPDDPRPPAQLLESQLLLADVYLALQRTGDVKSLLARTAEAARGRPDPTRDADLLSRQAEVEAALGAEASARSLVDQSLKRAEAASVPALAAADVRVRVAEIALRRAEFSLAESLTSRSIPVIEKSTAPQERLLRALHASARAQEGLGHSELALATVQRARGLTEQCFGSSSPRLAALQATEIELLGKLGRAGELDASRARLEEMNRARSQAPGNQVPDRKRLEDAEMNVSFVEPGPDWVEMPMGADSGGRVRAFRRAEPAMALVIQGQATDAPEHVTDEEIRAHAFDYSDHEAKGARVREILRTPRTIAGIAGTQTTEEWTFETGKELRVRWVGVRGGWLYILMVVSNQAPIETLVAEAKRAFEGFSPLDPSRVAERTPVQRTYRSERFGYSFDLADRRMVVVDAAEGPKHAEVFAKQQRSDGAHVLLMVIPVALGRSASDPEIVEAALLRLVDTRVHTWSEARVVDAFGARGRERDGRYEFEGRTVHVRARGFQREGVGWAIGASVVGLPETSVDHQLAAVNAVVIAPAVAPPASSRTEQERFRQSQFENELGLVYRASNQPARAIESFERSLELAPGELQVIENLAQARVDAGKFREAARGLDVALAKNPKRVTLLALRGVALRRVGEAAAAERDLRSAVENGHAAPEIYGEWIGSLFDLGRGEEALAVVDARLAKRGAVEDRVTRVFVLMRLGRSDAAVAELSGIAREYPSDAGVQQLLLDAALQSRDPNTLLLAVDQLLESVGSAPLLLALRGVALQALGRHDEAIAALDEALKLAPEATDLRELREQIVRDRTARTGPRT